MSAKVKGLSGKHAAKASTGSKLGINVEETMFATFKDEREMFVRDHVDHIKVAQMVCCPMCCLFVPMVSKKHKLEYTRACGPCSCPYAVKIGDSQVAKVRDIGCMENGCFFCMCPWLNCGGKIKIMSMTNSKSQKESILFAKSLFPCWPCVQGFAVGCAPLGACCIGMLGCFQYCKGREIRTITQPVYTGPWARTDGNDPEKLGDFTISQRFNPVGLCFAVPTPLTFFYTPTSEKGRDLNDEDLAALSLVLAIYRGLPVPCKLCSATTFQMPLGIPCTDVGLDTTTSWNTVQEVMLQAD